MREALVATAVFSGCGQCHHSEDSKAEACSSMALRRRLTIPARATVESHAVLSMQQEDWFRKMSRCTKGDKNEQAQHRNPSKTVRKGYLYLKYAIPDRN